jgi:subtilisin family serine protease
MSKIGRVLGCVVGMIGVVVAATVVDAPVAAQARSTYIVTFVDGTDARSETAALARAGAGVKHVYTNVYPGAALELTEAAAAALARNPQVSRVEADGVVTVSDSQTSAPWGLDRTDQRALPLSTTYSWNAAGAGVTAYIVDTGVLTTHVDFVGRTAAGYTAIADGKGTTDCNGHGTHVAGTTAGTTYGIAKQATVVPVRVLDCGGSGTWSGVIAGLDWIVAHHGTGPAVANMSLGGGASTSVDDAVRRVIADGVTVAVAAGNSSADACRYSPARVPEAVTVGSTTSSDARSSFSNFGTCLDVFAPGSSIRSAWYTSTTATNTISGTSMAAPHAAGVAAVLLSQTATLTPAEVSSLLASTATTNVVASAGTGSPNRLLYVDPSGPTTPPSSTPDSTTPTTATAPSAPTNVTAVAARRAATVAWTKGADGGSPLTGQTVWVYRGTSTVGSVAVSATSTSVKIGGLTAGVSYTFRITATNGIGTSPESVASDAVTPTR